MSSSRIALPAWPLRLTMQGSLGFFDNAVPDGNISKPVMLALGVLPVGKMFGQSGVGQPEQAPGPPGYQNGGGLLDVTIAGQRHDRRRRGWWRLDGLFPHFGQNGPGVRSQIPEAAVSPNQLISPNRLGSGLGETTISNAARHAGNGPGHI